jgi:SAM-dependent methyltransferase
MTRNTDLALVSRAGAGDAAIVRDEAHVRSVFGRRGRSSRYSWFDAAHLYAMQEVERGLLRLMASHGIRTLAGLDILDVGCGSGVWLRELIKWGADPDRVSGVELLEERVRHARRLTPPAVSIACGSATALAHADASFDLVLQSLVFTSILDPLVRRTVAGEMRRVLRPTGLVLWYDYHVDNPANPDVRGVPRTELAALFPSCRIEILRATLAPPLARVVAPRSQLMYRLLRAVPFLTTHYVAAIRPR